jgi:hypothetical protein
MYMDFSLTQIEVDATSFLFLRHTKVPVMYREMVNPSLASLRVLLEFLTSSRTPCCSIARCSYSYCNYSASNTTCSAHISQATYPFRARNFGSKEYQDLFSLQLSILTPGIAHSARLTSVCAVCSCTVGTASSIVVVDLVGRW